MRQQHVGAKADYRAHRVRFLLADRPVEVGGGVVAEAGRAERAFGDA